MPIRRCGKPMARWELISITIGGKQLEHYVVYVDDATNWSRIHRIDCRHYVDRKEEILPDNRWLHGPFTIEEAIRVEQGLGKGDSGHCGHCGN